MTDELHDADTSNLVVVIHMPGTGYEVLADIVAATPVVEVAVIALSQALGGIEECARGFGGQDDGRSAMAGDSAAVWARLQGRASGDADLARRPRVVFDADAWALWPVISRFQPTAKYLLLTRNCRDTIVSLLRENLFKCQSKDVRDFRRLYPGNSVLSSALLWEQRMGRVLQFRDGNLAPHEVVTYESFAGETSNALAAVGRLIEHDFKEGEQRAEAYSSSSAGGRRSPRLRHESAMESHERSICEALGPLHDYMPTPVYTRLERINEQLGYGALESGALRRDDREVYNLDAFERIHPGAKLTLDFRDRDSYSTLRPANNSRPTAWGAHRAPARRPS